MWAPKDDTWRSASSLYQGLAAAIADDVATGRLLPGDRLPTHRALARRLGVTVGTITRAYQVAKARGLARGETGRGTFVLTPTGDAPTGLALPAGTEASTVDLSRNLCLASSLPPELRRSLGETWRSVDPTVASERQPAAGAAASRAAARSFVPDLGHGDGIDHLVIAAGAQHALVCALAAVTRPGDTVAAAGLSYPGLRLAAELLGLEVAAVAIDPKTGLQASDLRHIAERGEVAALFCTPTLQNPTGSVMAAAERKAVAAVTDRHDITVIEDDTYRFLAPDAPPPLVTFTARGGIHISTLSKAVLAGLRVAYIQAVPALAEHIATKVLASAWMASPVGTALADQLISNGVGEAITAWKRDESAERLDLARRTLGHELADGEASCHGWLPVPAGSNASIVAELRANRVLVNPAEEFVPQTGTSSVPPGLRLCIGTPTSRDQMTSALQAIAHVTASSGRAAADHGP